jgi:hypothetical protein
MFGQSIFMLGINKDMSNALNDFFKSTKTTIRLAKKIRTQRYRYNQPHLRQCNRKKLCSP